METDLLIQSLCRRNESPTPDSDVLLCSGRLHTGPVSWMRWDVEPLLSKLNEKRCLCRPAGLNRRANRLSEHLIKSVPKLITHFWNRYKRQDWVSSVLKKSRELWGHPHIRPLQWDTLLGGRCPIRTGDVPVVQLHIYTSDGGLTGPGLVCNLLWSFFLLLWRLFSLASHFWVEQPLNVTHSVTDPSNVETLEFCLIQRRFCTRLYF